MGAWDPKLFNETGLRKRIDGILDELRMPNSTSAATAVANALGVDLRLRDQGDGVQQLLELTDDQIVDLALTLVQGITTKGAMFHLPLGSIAVTDLPGGIVIDRESWVLDADRSGLFPLDVVPAGAGGANLEALRNEMARLTRRHACNAIGLPSPHEADGDSGHELRFPPLEAAGGAVLRKSASKIDAPRFRSALPAQIQEFAADIVDDMKRLWAVRLDVADRVDAIRRDAEGRDVPAITVDMTPRRSAETFVLRSE